MGSCLSAHSVQIVDVLDTAKVIIIDGSLREYSIPTQVSEILEENKSSTASFLCSSDELDLDRDIHALSSHDRVKIGQLYFILPQAMLNRPLKGQDMAALAVKASLALPGALGKKTPGSTSEKRGIRVMPVCNFGENLDQTYTIGTKFEGRTSVRGRHNMSILAVIQEVAE